MYGLTHDDTTTNIEENEASKCHLYSIRWEAVFGPIRLYYMTGITSSKQRFYILGLISIDFLASI
jgi:hypothetical protein